MGKVLLMIILIFANYGAFANDGCAIYDAGTVKNAMPDQNWRGVLLKNARVWMYQIQDLETEESITALANTDYPLLIVEPNLNSKDLPSFNYGAMVKKLRKKTNGSRRLVLAYIDIGQAESWRTYFKEDWKAPGRWRAGEPDFLIRLDPDGWEGCYPVAYWDKRWQHIWLAPGGIIDRLAKAGFDGVYLDWVEAYDDDKVREAALKSNINPELAMINFIEKIGAVGKKITPGFLIVPQNAPFLIDSAPDRYAKAIDALAVEDTWFHGEGDAEWDDKKAGDQRSRYDGQGSTENRLIQYKKYLSRGLPVFSVDYCVKQKNAEVVYLEAKKAGLPSAGNTGVLVTHHRDPSW